MGPRGPSPNKIKVMSKKTGLITKQEDKATNGCWKQNSMTIALKYLNKQTCWEKLFGVTRSKEIEQMGAK